ncbi:phage major capsid protein [Bifidobacterium simiiventris]|uniref:phage major capsid protein n=1 Tax=Bifidobacterium simiiventris TaxID=2834434 RepID=UPI001C58114D|nr:phage major capsid protein [Bifidobacterium simiiventris]MBW3078225.1 phage major capsid protein [Bifidobacterium simiiventris]
MTTESMAGYGSAAARPASLVIPNAAVFTQATTAGDITGDYPSLYLPYVGSLSAAQIVAEGEEIKESDTHAKELAVKTQKVALLNVFTNESNATADGNATAGGSGADVVTVITEGMRKSITEKINAIFWQNPAPTDGQPESKPTGLFNYPGIIQGGNITNKLDPIIDAIAQVSANGGTPTALVMGYGTWAYLLKMRYAEGQPMINPDVANEPTPALFGVPVYLDNMAPDGKILVNSSKDVYSASGQITVSRTDDRYFEKDSFGVRITVRIGWGIPYPNHLAVLTVNQTTTTK